MVAIGAFIAVQVSYGRINGQHAGTALLVIMLALKRGRMGLVPAERAGALAGTTKSRLRR
jgi:hypothetical protein